MSIVIKDRQRKNPTEAMYVASFPSGENPPLTACSFPVVVDPANAEQMLQVLKSIYSLPMVYNYLQSQIPAQFFPTEKVSTRHILIQSLLNFLAGPSNVYRLDWKQGYIDYIKVSDSLLICNGCNDYFFLLDSLFTNAFVESFGEYQWQDIECMQVLTEREFCDAENEVDIILSPFETWFVAANVYEKLCVDLRNICSRLEVLLDQSIFIWNKELLHEPLLVNVLKENSSVS